MNTDIAKNVKTLRISRKLSQQQLAEKAGYTDKSAISLIEAGKVDVPYSKIIALADALRTTPAWLMGWEDEESAQISAEDHMILEAYHHSSDGIQESIRILLGIKGEVGLSTAISNKKEA